MPAWVNTGVEEYTARMPLQLPIKLIEVAAEKRKSAMQQKKWQATESERMLSMIPPKVDIIIALERMGKALSTLQLAAHMQTWHDHRQSIVFLIGGPEGLSDACVQKADLVWSLSALTMPHPLVRVVLSEQLYRAWSININHPYHR